eukprot:SAG11_NODE_2508_length_3271_cov_5.144388_1_plen_187_part_00
MAALPSAAELAAWHAKLRAIETKRVYKDLAVSLASDGWRQMPNFDASNPFSVSEAAQLIKEAQVQISDLSVDPHYAKDGAKEGDWTDEVGCAYLKRLRAFFGMGKLEQGTEMSKAMALDTEADDTQVQKILNFPGYAAFEGHVHKGDFGAAMQFVEKDDDLGRLLQRFSLTFDGLSHVKAGKEDKL